MPSPPPSWVDLPIPLTEKILELLPLSDYLRFTTVCRRWRSVQADHRRFHAPSPPPMLRLPWFVDDVDHRKRNEEIMSFFSPFEGRTYRLKTFGTSLISGWFFAGDAILNPVSGVRIPFPEPLKDTDIKALSPSPDLVLFVITESGELFFFRPGDPQCTRLQLPLVDVEEDVLVLSAVAFDGKLYCICGTFNEPPAADDLVIVDSRCTPPTVCSYEMQEWLLSMPERGPRALHTFNTTWLVESDGEPLLVKMLMYGFQVFRPDLSRQAWVTVGSLGDRVLIIHTIYSVSLVAADVGLRKNCIYYSGAKDDSYKWKVFDLAIGKKMKTSFPNASVVKADAYTIFLPCIC